MNLNKYRKRVKKSRRNSGRTFIAVNTRGHFKPCSKSTISLKYSFNERYFVSFQKNFVFFRDISYFLEIFYIFRYFVFFLIFRIF